MVNSFLEDIINKILNAIYLMFLFIRYEMSVPKDVSFSSWIKGSWTHFKVCWFRWFTHKAESEPSVSHNPSEIILLSWLGAQEKILILTKTVTLKVPLQSIIVITKMTCLKTFSLK